MDILGPMSRGYSRSPVWGGCGYPRSHVQEGWGMPYHMTYPMKYVMSLTPAENERMYVKTLPFDNYRTVW